jgi:AcrR family transcriptional regulator
MSLPAPARTPGRPRCDVTHKAVLRAAYDLLAEAGLAGFTIEAVAARSGVARTTIYRWWPSKGALAMEGFLEATAPDLAVPPTTSVVADMQALLRLFGRLLRGKAGRIIRGIIAEGQSDPETIKAFLVGFVMPRRAEVRAILARGVASGELRADVDAEMVLASLFGSLQMRMLMNENVDDSWVDRLSKFVLAGCMADRGGSSRSAAPMSMDRASASAGVI